MGVRTCPLRRTGTARFKPRPAANLPTALPTEESAAEAGQTAPAAASAVRTIPVTALLSALWLFGALAAALVQGGGYLLARRRLLRDGKTNRYTPLVSREAYQRQEGKTILGKLYEGSLKRFAAALHDGGALDKSDVEELRAYLEELEGKEGQ